LTVHRRLHAGVVESALHAHDALTVGAGRDVVGVVRVRSRQFGENRALRFAVPGSQDEDRRASAATASRSASKGRLACGGSSLRLESARITAKPQRPTCESAASEPPAITTSARPALITSRESPIACVAAAQAVITVFE
jgi:hypothetical protein